MRPPEHSRPYATAALAYRNAGWLGVLPLPAGRKEPPPSGFTGKDGADPDDEQVARWIIENGNRNLALRMPADVIGIDVDAYPPKRGGETLRAAEAAWGPLPATWRSSSRDDDPVSGIRYYRIPAGVRLHGAIKIENGQAVAADGTEAEGTEAEGAATSDVEIVQRHHRYAIVEPSIHPEGRVYAWWLPDTPDGGRVRRPSGGDLPHPDLLPCLPATWIEALRVADPRQARSPRGNAEPASEEEILSGGEACPTVARTLSEAVAHCAGGSRHDHVLGDVGRLVRLGEQGHPGVGPSLRVLRGAYVAAVGPDRDGPAVVGLEFDRMVEGAIGIVQRDPTGPEDRGCRCGGEVRHGGAEPAPRTGGAWPDPLNEAAFHGVAGDLVRAVEAHTEADPAAILIQFLVAFGNAIGRSAYFLAEGDRHYPNLFAVQVAETAKGRKGTSWGRVRAAMGHVDEGWVRQNLKGGLSSGEGLINAVRDPVTKYNSKGEPYIVPGIEDKRLLIYEPEFSSVLRQAMRDGNILSDVLRQAWDSGDLHNLTVEGRHATAAHISVVGHVTKPELLRRMQETEAANGFGNRFLWYCARRSKLLPDGGGHPDLSGVVAALSAAFAYAQKGVGLVRRDDGAREVWHAVYGPLSEGKPGLLGALIARAEPQVMRLAMLYALLDRSALIRVEHLEAALAVWQYCEDSARYIFGEALGDPTADTILEALRANPEGLTREQISPAVFGRHKSSAEISRALAALLNQNLATVSRIDTAGRAAELWRAR